MKFCFYTNSVSPHQLPLARELINRLGAENYRYVYTTPLTEGRKKCGWGHVDEPWIIQARYGEGVVDEMLENCDILLSGQRVLDLFEKRAARGLKTYYYSERWFKPISIGVGQRCRCSFPGWLRMLVPSYCRMTRRFVRWMNSDSNARCLTIGPWAKKDMLRIGVDESKIVPWGYFVAPSDQESKRRCPPHPSTSTLKVLWVGRMLYLKRVDTIIRAVREVEKKRRGGILLTLVGDGPEKPHLQHFAARMLTKVDNSTVNLQPQPDTITFLPARPIDKIREIMREHDVFVFASNACDGWGAVVSEALEEGLVVIGTCETGASATLLAAEWQFHFGDWRRLADLLMICAVRKVEGVLRGQGIGDWSAEKAAERLCGI